MRILVTGGSGFIGSALIRYLIAETAVEVLNVDKLTHAAVPEALTDVEDNPRYSFERLDIRDEKRLAEVFHRLGPQAVVHLAAESHVDRSIDRPGPFIDTNICQRRSIISPPGRSKTSPLNVMRYAVLGGCPGSP